MKRVSEKKVCKKSANCDKIELVSQEADLLWQEEYHRNAVNSATLTLKEGSGLSATSTIGVYNYTGESWDEGSVYSASRWNGVELSRNVQSYKKYILI